METGKIGKRIGFMGGTFNPIHTGHLLLAEYAREACLLDKVLFIPTGNSYMKNRDEILSGKERLQMVNLAIEGCEYFESSDIEITRGGNTYTCDTLLELKQIYPEAVFYFLTGADSFLGMDKWRNPDVIMENSVLVVVTRDGASVETLEAHRKYLLEKYGGKIQIVAFPTVDISSTEIRNRVKNGKTIRFQTPDKVVDYITAHDLYR